MPAYKPIHFQKTTQYQNIENAVTYLSCVNDISNAWNCQWCFSNICCNNTQSAVSRSRQKHLNTCQQFITFVTCIHTP